MQHIAALALFLLAPALLAQGTLTVPAAYDAADAPSRLWLAGVTADLRQLTVIDSSHLTTMVGRDLTALVLRRNPEAEPTPGGTATLTVRIGHAAAPPLQADPVFAGNLLSPTTVFQGAVVLPSAGASAAASWSAPFAIRIPFQTPFRYLGGPLAIDITGIADPHNPVPWWPLDAAWDATTGMVQHVGHGCGSIIAGDWAQAAAPSLVAGGTAQLWASGTPNGLALLFLGAPASLPGFPLDQLLGWAMPGCRVYLPLPAASMLVTSFLPTPVPGVGRASATIRIPNQPWALSASFGSQWVDVQQQFATSNAVNCTVGSAVPTLGMTVVRGLPADSSGIVITHLAHVLRFEFQ